MQKSKLVKIIPFALLLLLSASLLPGSTHAASTININSNQGFCEAAITQKSSGFLVNWFAGTNSINLAGLSNLITISMLIIFVMLVIIALAFTLGYAFGIKSLVNFSKVEFGEIIITVLIIAFFVGAAGTIPLIHLTSQQTQNIFVNDCNYLAGSSLYVFNVILSNFIPRSLGIELLSNLQIHLSPLAFGIDFSPLTGYALVQQSLSIAIDFSSMVASMFLGLIMFLSIVYMIFPLFLYIGIVLRTVPFTRAAGGAFLGLFIGFYIVFPLMLNLLLSAQGTSINPIQINQNQTITSVLTNMKNTPSALSVLPFIKNFFDSFSVLGTFNQFIDNIVVPMMYTLFVVIISIMVSLDFSELVGDFLGAESLSSKNTLRKII